MTYTKVSTKYQVVIPKEVRQGLSLRPGQRLIVMGKQGVICLIPEIPRGELKGFFRGRGLSSKGIRDKRDRL